LNTKRSEWYEMVVKTNALKWIQKTMAKHRDLFGYFENYQMMVNEIEKIRDTSITMEKYEIAEKLSYWIIKLPNS